jgi:hypothetical protein
VSATRILWPPLTSGLLLDLSEEGRFEALFMSRFRPASPEATADDIEESLNEQLSLRKFVCTRLNTEFNTFASCHVSSIADEFPLIIDSCA